MEFICEGNMVNFLDYEKKTGSQDKEAADAAVQPGSSQSIKGGWTGRHNAAGQYVSGSDSLFFVRVVWHNHTYSYGSL
jgi:hypothetical protein